MDRAVPDGRGRQGRAMRRRSFCGRTAAAGGVGSGQGGAGIGSLEAELAVDGSINACCIRSIQRRRSRQPSIPADEPTSALMLGRTSCRTAPVRGGPAEATQAHPTSMPASLLPGQAGRAYRRLNVRVGNRPEASAHHGAGDRCRGAATRPSCGRRQTAAAYPSAATSGRAGPSAAGVSPGLRFVETPLCK